MKFIEDNEIELIGQNDILATKKYADSLKEIILSVPTPFNIGLYGEWGSGKSSIVKTAQKELEAKKDIKIKFIVYDAWKYANDSFRRMFLKHYKKNLSLMAQSFLTHSTSARMKKRKLNQNSTGSICFLLYWAVSLRLFWHFYSPRNPT